ncbi:exopolysaccharide biosynthesis polyprenyl glycosylphosphotransferase [Xanthomonas campestris pv. phormiicola]|nr:exopolysaccharide biosynthesis polyprenyl glycosylphosphotransferase [Xanthomonas campestris pv. phormiicola]UYC16031.1 exopolysaccharide biosynthesis polyprenyl glycosylphosphotransferase [Xanthomonas campestris pv. phormiicola]
MRSSLPMLAVEAFGMASMARLSMQALHAAQRRIVPRRRSVALVASPESVCLLPRLLRMRGHGYRLAAVYDAGAPEGGLCAGLPVVNRFQTLRVLVRQRAIDELWLLGPLHQSQQAADFVRAFRHDFVDIRFIPDLRDFALAQSAAALAPGLPVIDLAAAARHAHWQGGKRLFDVLFAAAALLALSPLMGAIAVAVRLDSPGPSLFRQKRMGADGRCFEICKFRTMRAHAEAAGTLTQARRHDPRVTTVGRFLRRTSLDELPQFINVLKGQMSLVGPRPHALQHDDLYKDLVHDYMYRYRIKPGITGWAQVHGLRGEIDSIDKVVARVAHDLHYIQHRSMAMDLKIIAMTLYKGFVHKNAY